MHQTTHDVLVRFCERLVKCCDEILETTFPAKEDDHLAFMLGTWAPMQREHLHGVNVLIDRKCFVQAGILARTMLEGFGLIYWAKDDDDRAKRWRAYCLIHDLQLLREKQKGGETLDPSKEPDLLNHLKKDAQVFLTKKAKERASKDGLDSVIGDPKSYQDVWHIDVTGKRHSVSSILGDELGDEGLRDLYGYFSQYVHWGVDGIAKYISRTDSGYEVNPQAQPRDALSAMAMAFQACIQTFILLAVHFKRIGDQKTLRVLREDYLAAVSPPARSSDL